MAVNPLLTFQLIQGLLLVVYTVFPFCFLGFSYHILDSSMPS